MTAPPLPRSLAEYRRSTQGSETSADTPDGHVVELDTSEEYPEIPPKEIDLAQHPAPATKLVAPKIYRVTQPCVFEDRGEQVYVFFVQWLSERPIGKAEERAIELEWTEQVGGFIQLANRRDEPFTVLSMPMPPWMIERILPRLPEPPA